MKLATSTLSGKTCWNCGTLLASNTIRYIDGRRHYCAVCPTKPENLNKKEMNMSNFLERLVEESVELDGKLVKLTAFHNSEPFFKLKIDDQNDLQEQLYCMSQYSGILRKRVAKAKGYYTGWISNQNQNSGVCASNDQHLIEPTE